MRRELTLLAIFLLTATLTTVVAIIIGRSLALYFGVFGGIVIACALAWGLTTGALRLISRRWHR